MGPFCHAVPLLAQNVTDEEGKLLTGAGWTILERGGIRLGVIGVVTPDVQILEGLQHGSVAADYAIEAGKFGFAYACAVSERGSIG